MAQRISTQFVEARIATVNRLLGHPDDAGYGTEGLVFLYSAYDAYGIYRYTGGHGGASDLMGGLGTKRECANFLQGMIVALDRLN